jgi:hypothetical protein
MHKNNYMLLITIAINLFIIYSLLINDLCSALLPIMIIFISIFIISFALFSMSNNKICGGSEYNILTYLLDGKWTFDYNGNGNIYALSLNYEPNEIEEKLKELEDYLKKNNTKNINDTDIKLRIFTMLDLILRKNLGISNKTDANDRATFNIDSKNSSVILNKIEELYNKFTKEENETLIRDLNAFIKIIYNSPDITEAKKKEIRLMNISLYDTDILPGLKPWGSFFPGSFRLTTIF